MKTPWPEITGILFLHLGIFTANAQSLSIRATANKATQITWASGITDLMLEETSELGPSALWRPIALSPALANNQYSVTVDASGGARFFRLHSGALEPLTTIRESSPADGETGVAVTRETIVHFSLPLADTTVLKTNNFYATFGGRRILSRIELAADRRKATLFYLEPLPGGARIHVFFDAEGLKDSLGRPLDPAGTGQANGFKLIQFDTLSLTPLAATAVIGRVFASELVPGVDTGANAVNKPLAGVTITVDGMEQTLRAVTDAQGNFTLSPVPPGRFFVHIDGRTVTDAAAGIHYPDKSYYPSVGKAWDAVAGRTNNLAGGTGNIFLPLIKVGTLQPVSMAQDTTISFPSNITADNPALAGVFITVPANSLFSDDGTRGGKVGIAPVPPDRLPGPLPPGLELPLVITVQTDGPLNFDRPAPVCFPQSAPTWTGSCSSA
ncbi:MAG: Ig-like domain-containing protein [Verrucomicrobiales bacterium]|nr:Ig-like domain-containing protein [Verrucomicrobiales bacterium]